MLSNVLGIRPTSGEENNSNKGRILLRAMCPNQQRIPNSGHLQFIPVRGGLAGPDLGQSHHSRNGLAESMVHSYFRSSPSCSRTKP